MDVAITGSSGLVGTALAAALRTDGHDVVRVVRSEPPHGERAVRWDPAAGTIDAAGLDGVDAVVHLAGESIGAGRWTADQKRRILDSRVQGTRLLAETLAGLTRKPGVLVSGSAIGYYGNRGDEVLTEDAVAGGGFLADVCVQWEQATASAAEPGIRVARIRTGPVLSLDGGAFPRLVRPARFGLGGRLGSGRQWMSWITLDDHVAAIRFLLDQDVTGPVNVVAPNPVTNAAFARTLGRVLRRPTFIPTPAFGPKLVLGKMAEELLFYSQRARPAVLMESGYTFADPELEPALRRLLDRPA
ncbi:MAG: TIGR01777 family oxidoreductase [Acidimicrobiales bacterium]